MGELAEKLVLRQPTVSHHLAALSRSGVVTRTPEGRLAWYSVHPDHSDRVSELLDGDGTTAVADAVLTRISADLATRFTGVFARETVDRYVRESHALLAGTPGSIRHLTSRTASFAAERLTALARSESQGRQSIPEVLFVCVQNAGRSQLAAAILHQLAGDAVRVRTAGSAPAASVRSIVVTVLDEIGASLGGEFPKPLTDEVVRAADVVVTMGCGDACPVYPGRTFLDWPIDDPAGLPTPDVRRIRDEIEVRVRALLQSLQVNVA